MKNKFFTFIDGVEDFWNWYKPRLKEDLPFLSMTAAALISVFCAINFMIHTGEGIIIIKNFIEVCDNNKSFIYEGKTYTCTKEN